jgi:peroxiredoxin
VDIENEISETSGAKKPSIKLLFYRSAEGAAIPKSKDALKPASHSVWNEISTKAPIPHRRCKSANYPEHSIYYYSGVRRTASFSSLILICLLWALSGCYSGKRSARIGSNAPDFTVQDSQSKVTLSQLRGQVIVLNFWATWCAPCVEEMPSLVDMQRRLKGKGVTVLAISVDVDGNAYQQFVKNHNVNLLTVRDPDQKSNALYGTSKFPETYIIDRNGVIRRKFMGAVDWTAPDVTDFLSRL